MWLFLLFACQSEPDPTAAAEPAVLEGCVAVTTYEDFSWDVQETCKVLYLDADRDLSMDCVTSDGSYFLSRDQYRPTEHDAQWTYSSADGLSTYERWEELDSHGEPIRRETIGIVPYYDGDYITVAYVSEYENRYQDDHLVRVDETQTEEGYPTDYSWYTWEYEGDLLVRAESQTWWHDVREYSYDEQDRLIRIRDTSDDERVSFYYYEYDSLNRVTRIRKDDDADGVIDSVSTISYLGDLDWEIAWESDDGVDGVIDSTSRTTWECP